MLDIKSKLVLKILMKECPGGSYKIIEEGDIINAMPGKYRVDSDGLQHILAFLERQDCIIIKYDDDGVYCLCVLPQGSEILENDTKKGKEKKKITKIIWLCLMLFLLIFAGALAASLVARFIP